MKKQKLNLSKNLLILFILTTLTWNCQYIVDVPWNGDDKPSNHDSVIITDAHPDSLQLDAFDLDSVSVNGNILTLTVSFSGGCTEHDFKLFMSPSVFMESNPVQANLYLKHNANGDLCEAYPTEHISFNIAKIAENYRNAYQSRAGVVLLNIYEYYEGESEKRIQVAYTFL